MSSGAEARDDWRLLPRMLFGGMGWGGEGGRGHWIYQRAAVAFRVALTGARPRRL